MHLNYLFCFLTVFNLRLILEFKLPPVKCLNAVWDDDFHGLFFLKMILPSLRLPALSTRAVNHVRILPPKDIAILIQTECSEN